MGERTVETYGSCTFEDLTNKTKAMLVANTFKKTGWISRASTGCKDEVQGVIYKSNDITGSKESIKKLYEKDCEFIHDIKDIKDIKK